MRRPHLATTSTLAVAFFMLFAPPSVAQGPPTAFAPEAAAPDPGQAWPPNPLGPPQATFHKPLAFALHWTAASGTATFNFYHWCIQGSGKVVPTLSERVRGAHVAGTNTGVVGIAWCAMAGGGMRAGRPFSTSAPITPLMVERMACLLAERSVALRIPLRGEVLLPSGLRVPRAAGHGWYAAKGVPGVIAPYPGLRWELGGLEAEVVPKAEWYRVRLVDGRRRFELSTR